MIDGLEGIQTVGIINALKTGNVALDMTIAMLIPIFIGSIFTSAAYFQKKILEINWRLLFSKKKKLYERYITHSTMTSVYSTTDLGAGDSQNEVLIKAIQLYLDHTGLLKLKRAELELRQMDKDDSKDSYYYYYHDDENTSTFADTLAKYKIVKKPMNNIWLDVGKYPSKLEKSNDTKEIVKDYLVNLIVTEEQENVDEKDGGSSSLKHKREIKLHFTSEGKESIDTFIDKAYVWYIDQLRTLEDDTRHLYELIKSKTGADGDGDGDDSRRNYKRYQLSEEKTFESLFFKEKENILNVVDHFTNRSGKYSVKGYPHKLGLLLHGPPGTGKTSLIKALAQKTGRSIVNVPLARISTNAELADLFFDQKYYVQGERIPVKLNFKDVIFVMEDVDAVSKVVRRRDGKINGEAQEEVQVEMPATKSLWRMLLESHNDDCTGLVEMLLKKSDRLKQAANDPILLKSIAQKMGSIPGLSLVGESTNNNETLSTIAAEAVEGADKLLSSIGTVDNFIGNHAKALKRMVESGTEINEDFENELLGTTPSGDSVFSASSFVSLRKGCGYMTDNDDIHTDTPPVPISPDAAFPSQDVASVIEAMNHDDNAAMMMVGEGKTMMGVGPSNVTSAWKAKRDELNLTGLLNVLDGVVDTPGRMLVMTTNHPEMLDPALIRPGRIDKKLLLGHLRYEDLVGMVEHYFQMKLNETQQLRLKLAVDTAPALKLTPAQVEQMACEFDEVDDMIKKLESKRESGKNVHNGFSFD